jgi:hypothetical protein
MKTVLLQPHNLVKKRTAEPQNVESSSGGQVSKDGIASGFAFGYDPTGRSVFYKIDRSTQKLTTGRIHYSTFDVGRSMFDVH